MTNTTGKPVFPEDVRTVVQPRKRLAPTWTAQLHYWTQVLVASGLRQAAKPSVMPMATRGSPLRFGDPNALEDYRVDVFESLNSLQEILRLNALHSSE